MLLHHELVNEAEAVIGHHWEIEHSILSKCQSVNKALQQLNFNFLKGPQTHLQSAHHSECTVSVGKPIQGQLK